MSETTYYFIRESADLDNFMIKDFELGSGMSPFLNEMFSRHSFRTMNPPTPRNIVGVRLSGDIPHLQPYNYELDRPIRFSNNIREAFDQYKKLRQASKEIFLDEIKQQHFAGRHLQSDYQQLRAKDAEQIMIPPPKTFDELAAQVSDGLDKVQPPGTQDGIRYIDPSQPNKGIMEFLKDAHDEIDQELSTDSELWDEFVDIYNESKLFESIEYAEEFTGNSFGELVNMYENDFQDLTHSNAKSSRQYSLKIPQEWLSPEIIACAREIRRDQLLNSGEIPELYPFDHNEGDMEQLRELEINHRDELLTQQSLLAAATSTNSIDISKEDTLMKSLAPFVAFESNIFSLLEATHRHMMTTINHKHSTCILSLRDFQDSLEIDVSILKQLDSDALDRFRKMHSLHQQTMEAMARGADTKARLFHDLRHNVLNEYNLWLQTNAPDQSTALIQHLFAAEKSAQHAHEKLQDEVDKIITRDRNVSVKERDYLEHTKEKREEINDGIQNAVHNTRKLMVKVIEDEFDKLDRLMDEISTADKEFDLYINKVHEIKREWDRYLLLMKAAVIKALILEDEDPEEADALLESSNRAVLNMEFLSKIMIVIGKDLYEVAKVADKRVQNMYTMFNPNLKPHESINVEYPVPEPYILSSEIIIPEPKNDFQAEDQYLAKKKTRQQRIEEAYLQDDISLQRYNPSLDHIPEELLQYDSSTFADRTPERIADSGTAGIEKWFNKYLLADAHPSVVIGPDGTARVYDGNHHNTLLNDPHLATAMHDGDQVQSGVWGVVKTAVASLLNKAMPLVGGFQGASTRFRSIVPAALYNTQLAMMVQRHSELMLRQTTQELSILAENH